MQVRSNTTTQIASEYATRTWELMSRIATCCAEKKLIARGGMKKPIYTGIAQLRYHDNWPESTELRPRVGRSQRATQSVEWYCTVCCPAAKREQRRAWGI